MKTSKYILYILALHSIYAAHADVEFLDEHDKCLMILREGVDLPPTQGIGSPNDQEHTADKVYKISITDHTINQELRNRISFCHALQQLEIKGKIKNIKELFFNNPQEVYIGDKEKPIGQKISHQTEALEWRELSNVEKKHGLVARYQVKKAIIQNVPVEALTELEFSADEVVLENITGKVPYELSGRLWREANTIRIHNAGFLKFSDKEKWQVKLLEISNTDVNPFTDHESLRSWNLPGQWLYLKNMPHLEYIIYQSPKTAKSRLMIDNTDNLKKVIVDPNQFSGLIFSQKPTGELQNFLELQYSQWERQYLQGNIPLVSKKIKASAVTYLEEAKDPAQNDINKRRCDVFTGEHVYP